MNKAEKPVRQATAGAPRKAPAKRVFVKPTLERHERLPEITGLQLLSIPSGF